MSNGDRSHLLDDPAVTSVLAEGRQAHVAVEAKTGPHVTPELYTYGNGALAFFSAASTLKSSVLPKRPRAGAVVRAGNRTVVLAGEVEAVDPASADGIVRALTSPVDTAKAIAGFAVRNAPDLAAFARDFVHGDAGGPLPDRRVLFQLLPDRVAVLDGNRIVATSGTWRGTVPADPAADHGHHDSTSATAVNAEPGRDNSTSAVVGWGTPDGPLALPARWSEDTSSATLPAELVALAAVPESAPACVTVDDFGGAGPAAKTGVILRGTGTLTTDSDGSRITLDVDRTSTWDGIETTTTRAASA